MYNHEHGQSSMFVLAAYSMAILFQRKERVVQAVGEQSLAVGVLTFSFLTTAFLWPDAHLVLLKLVYKH